MNRVLLNIALFLALTLAFPIPLFAGNDNFGPLNPPARKELLARLRLVQSSIKTLRADFVEERKISGLKNPLVFEGKLFLKQKGFLFLEYYKPVKHILKIDGGTVLFYVKGSKTADTMNLAAVKNGAPMPDFFNPALKNFQGPIREKDDGFYLEQGGNTGRKVTIILDRTSLLAAKIIIAGEGGDVTTISLHKMVVNKPLPDGVKNFALPPGTTLHAMTEQ